MPYATANLITARTADVNNWSTDQGVTFRDYVAGIHNMVVAAGLVPTADTGQIDHTTVLAAPTVAGGSGNFRGSKLYRFDDALQGTAPLFVRLGFYVFTTNVTAGGVGASYGWMCSVSLSDATTGTAGLAGFVYQNVLYMSGNQTATATTTTNYDTANVARAFKASHGPGYFWISFGELGATQAGRIGMGQWIVERLRTPAGVLTGDGVCSIHWGTGGTLGIATAVGVVVTTNTRNKNYGAGCETSGNAGSIYHLFHNPPEMTSGTGLAAGLDVALLPVVPYDPLPRGQLSSVLAYSSVNFTRNDTIPVTVNGEALNFVALGAARTTPTNASYPLAMRMG